VPPASPARQLQFVPSGDPVVCDASERPAGALRGAVPRETLRLTSSELSEPITLAADGDGAATVTWQCDPDAAGPVKLTAWSADGDRLLTFTVTGVSEPDAPSLAELDAQARVDAAADVVLDAVEPTRNSDFAGIVVDPARERVAVYWRGSPPPPVVRAIERAHATTGVGVAVRPADHTRRELLRAARVLVAGERLPRETQRLAELAYRIALRPQGDSIEVSVARPDGIDDADLTRWSRRARRALAAAVAVPVRLVVDAPAREFGRGRLNDAPPWRGGAAIVGEGRCSTGFAVRRAGVRRRGAPVGVLTAAHCHGDPHGVFRDGTGSREVGPERGRIDERLDARVIPTDAVEARIYSGGVGRASEFTRPVRGTGRNHVGDAVCTSGAATGAHCDLVVVNVDSFYRPAGTGAWYRVVEATARDRDAGVAAGEGDSGGPVFTVTADGGVEARGTIAGGWGEVACGRDGLGVCTGTVAFVDIGAALDHHRAELVTIHGRQPATPGV
jgi:hypothetical protein